MRIFSPDKKTARLALVLIGLVLFFFDLGALSFTLHELFRQASMR